MRREEACRAFRNLFFVSLSLSCSRYINKCVPFIVQGWRLQGSPCTQWPQGALSPFVGRNFQESFQWSVYAHIASKGEARKERYKHAHTHTRTHMLTCAQKAGAAKTRDWRRMCEKPETCGTPEKGDRKPEQRQCCRPVADTLQLRGGRSQQGGSKHLNTKLIWSFAPGPPFWFCSFATPGADD